ncbi:AAA domain-containing protein [Roseimicrobium sp. ORNL1]|uniref:AAA domain-containing protein n=1 Tax=Roseimicrobium sp. ORNL1 TaxID=2711231 RepID=UPI0013E100E3|nr:AAA domain-containing protein [Roseimicrobium sp. ORNL1]QIF04265.1 AAA family ATPase [Roseimicrobium sp. ORNL1]
MPEYLQEFKVALREEIEAAKKNLASTAVLLSQGKLIAPIGSSFHYEFQTQRQLRVPPDTPGELRLDSGQNVNVIIVESTETEVTLDVPVNFGRIVPNAKLITNLTMLLEKLISRIEEKGETPHPAAERILGLVAPSGSPVDFQRFNRQLNVEQSDAVASVLGRDTTFIWGPPGTGKTQTIGEIGAQLYTRNKTLLIVSHTNTAVDEALLRIADALKGKFEEGDVLRLGEPVRSDLAAQPSLILKRVAEKRARELEEKKKRTEDAKDRALKELQAVHRKVDIAQWLAEMATELDAFKSRFDSIEEKRGKLDALERYQKESAKDVSGLVELRTRALRAQESVKELLRLKRECDSLKATLPELRKAEGESAAQLREADGMCQSAAECEPLRNRLRALPQLEVATGRASTMRLTANEALAAYQQKMKELDSSSQLLEKTLAVGSIKRMWLKLPKPEEQEQEMSGLRNEVNKLAEVVADCERRAAASEQMLNEIHELIKSLERYSSIPDLPASQHYRSECQSYLEIQKENVEKCEATVNGFSSKMASIEAEVAGFMSENGGLPDEVVTSVDLQMRRHEASKEELERLRSQVRREEGALKQDLDHLVKVLVEWKLCSGSGNTVFGQMSSITRARTEAQREVGSKDYDALVTERNRLSAQVAQFIEEIKAIEESLKTIEAELLAKVKVLATTLTRAYMRNGIQERRFDTVLLDEASMAPIPALWASATVADRAVVAVGDFKQLPPIVQSDEPVALRWLGRDIFEASGVQGAYERKEFQHHFVALKEQHRMHPDISAIVNALIYDGLLRNGGSVSEKGADASIMQWHAGIADDVRRVTLLDSGSLDAWNTTADRSRFNLLSAMVCLELLKLWLRADRPSASTADKKRVLIISPYRPHAKIIDLLVREEGLEAEIAVNTAHSFQGNEADAVLLDLVVDEPHFSANLMTPAASEDISRLLNVAITRARRKLVILADLNWLQSKGGGAFVGGKLLPWMNKRYGVTNAMEAMASCGERKQVAFGREFATRILEEINTANECVILFSPLLDAAVVQFLAPSLRAFVAKGARAFVVTQTVGEQRREGSSHEKGETLLREVGVVVVHKIKMRDKLCLIDDRIVWASTFPVLCKPSPQGFAIRRESVKFSTEVRDLYCTEQMIGAYQPDHLCPVCRREMVAAEAREGHPYYWRCIEQGCYTRDLTTPAPVNGMITMRCESSPVFGYWGEVPHWLCSCGQRPGHRTKVHANHLRLPKMRALIPQRSWRKVCSEIGFDADSVVQGSLEL